MSTQKAGPSFPNLGATRSWTTHQAPSLDPKTGNFKTGLIYITQNEHTGDVFIGGELQSYDQILVSDDTVIPDIPAQNLATILPKIFKGWDNTEPVAKRIWSGIMGFTADAVPLVGLLPEDVTGRAGTGEWIAAGFNGYGMDKCWLSGEALVGLMTGDEKAVPLPKAYTLSQERLGEGMKRNFWVEMISGIAHE
jgi:glycine/D-amino acid oxidase-like deaminating enzyme